jgi:hypothetical protein
MPTLNSPIFSGYKTRQIIAEEYHMSTKTLLHKLKEKKILLPPGRVNLKDQRWIYETLGYPPGISKKDYESV